jgi:hypothetical protein
MLLVVGIGCSTTNSSLPPIVTTEYQVVNIPVIIPIDLPKKPILNKQELPVYLSEVLIYTQMLETIIQEHNNAKIIKNNQK